MLSCQARRLPQWGQWLGGSSSDSCRGSRQATTLRKLPTQAPSSATSTTMAGVGGCEADHQGVVTGLIMARERGLDPAFLPRSEAGTPEAGGSADGQPGDSLSSDRGGSRTVCRRTVCHGQAMVRPWSGSGSATGPGDLQPRAVGAALAGAAALQWLQWHALHLGQQHRLAEHHPTAPQTDRIVAVEPRHHRKRFRVVGAGLQVAEDHGARQGEQIAAVDPIGSRCRGWFFTSPADLAGKDCPWCR